MYVLIRTVIFDLFCAYVPDRGPLRQFHLESFQVERVKSMLAGG